MDIVGTIIAALGAVGLFVLGLFADAWRTRLGISAAKKEREELRSVSRQDRREEFELEALLELQEIILLMARQAGATFAADDAHFAATGKWITGAPPLPEAVGGEESLVPGRTFLKLKARVPAERLRSVLEYFHNACVASIVPTPGD